MKTPSNSALESRREAIKNAATALRELAPKIAREPERYAQASLVIVLAVAKAYRQALRQASQTNRA